MLLTGELQAEEGLTEVTNDMQQLLVRTMNQHSLRQFNFPNCLKHSQEKFNLYSVKFNLMSMVSTAHYFPGRDWVNYFLKQHQSSTVENVPKYKE